jgi:hypothetical protein
VQEALKMNKKEVVLACLAPARRGLHSPVQIQKLLFLIDRNIPLDVGGPHFNFQPYSYGPFDATVYDVLEELAGDRYIEAVAIHRWTDYMLTEKGQALGEKLLAALPERTRTYIEETSLFVRSLSFTQLISAIYKAYPEMRLNSVFQE